MRIYNMVAVGTALLLASPAFAGLSEQFNQVLNGNTILTEAVLD